MYNAVICRYHEIAIKGNNRREFEKQLMGNMRHFLRDKVNCKVRQVRGRIWIEHPDRNALFSETELAAVREILSRIFGLESFSPARLVRPEMDAIRDAVAQMAPPVFAARFARQQTVSFRIRARRSNKEFPLRSKEIEIDLAAVVARGLENDDRLTVDLDDADVTIGCEVRHEFAAVFLETFRAPGGLPVGCNGRVLGLLSGGIDSPVAAYLAMKRGCFVDFITFHSAPYTPPESVDKVRRLAEKLNAYQPAGTLYVCNLAPLQKQIRDLCTERNRTVLYRRAMLRIAEKTARRHHCGALLTGEAVGQVASQTLTNMSTINAAVDLLVLRPLCGADKADSIRIAEAIDTYPISIIHAPDSCTVFAPASPATAVPRHIAEAEESKIPDYEALLDAIAENAEVFPSGGLR